MGWNTRFQGKVRVHVWLSDKDTLLPQTSMISAHDQLLPVRSSGLAIPFFFGSIPYTL